LVMMLFVDTPPSIHFLSENTQSPLFSVLD
jgi:hypothetical protein